jgi:hypothetical protein
MKSLPIDKLIPEEYHCKNMFCKIFSHWLNPFGNWNEPLPYPEHRKFEASQQWLPPSVWWNIRNPFHNFCHYWIGITPLGPRYAWILPEANGWVREPDYKVTRTWSFSRWKKSGRISLPFAHNLGSNWEFYIGWLSRGNFGMALRKIP